MDQKRRILLLHGLNLSEQEKQTVRALRRQIAFDSTSSPTKENGDHLVAKLSEKELSLLRNVVQTFKNYKADFEPIRNEGDGRRVQRDWSEESCLSTNSGSGAFVNPARFYVHVTKEDVRTLEQVCIGLEEEEEAEKSTKPNSNGHLNDKSDLSLKDEYENYGFSVALAKQSETITGVENATTGTLSEPAFTKQSNFSLIDGSVAKHKPEHRGGLRYLPPRERFRQATYMVINNLEMRPRKVDNDFPELWQKRGNATWLTVFLSVVAIGAFFADIGTDLKVASDHFTKGNHLWWGGLTLMLVILPSVVTSMVSFFWYKEDDKQMGRPPKSGWKVVSVTHFFLVGLVER